MANTPPTPVHLSEHQLAEITPTMSDAPDTVQMSSGLATTISTLSVNDVKAKPLTNKQKMQRALANLYGDEDGDLITLESPAKAIEQLPQREFIEQDVVMEDPDSVEVIGEDVQAELPVDDALEVSEIPESAQSTELVIRTEWLGTSQFYLEPLLELQKTVSFESDLAIIQHRMLILL